MHPYWIVFLPAIAYQLLAIVAALRHLARRWTENSKFAPSFQQPGISIFKPVRGLDPSMAEAFVSQAKQEYPVFEILFGARDEEDFAVAEISRLQKLFPQVAIRLILGSQSAGNGKVGVLMEMARYARYPIWVVADSDIKVTPNYLSRVVAPLADPSVGVVSCLYRARAHSIPSVWEALGIATDFMPSTLVAPLVGVREFGLGSTLAFRGEDLKRAGGFEAIADYLADDYQLAKRITMLGKRSILSTYVVETSLGDLTWRSSWFHQLRWARTIRSSKRSGYVGLPVTQAGLWILVATISGAWIPAAFLLAARVLSALLTGGFVLGSALAAGLCWLAPLWDLYAFTVWAVSYANRDVRWRDRALKIDRHGRIVSQPEHAQAATTAAGR